MKIIARLDNNQGYLIQINRQEMSEIVSGNEYGIVDYSSGEEVRVHPRFKRVIDIATTKIGSKSYDSIRYHLEQLLHNLQPVEALVTEVKEKVDPTK